MADRDRSWIGGRIRTEDQGGGGPAESGKDTPVGKFIIVAVIVLVFGGLAWWLGSWVMRFFGKFFARFDEMGP